jgi:predicted RNA-binding Zn ribbon-like protein
VFRWLGEPLAIDLANTVMVVGEESVDLLASAAELEDWLERQRPRLGDCRFALGHLAELRALREDVRDLLAATATAEPLPQAALRRVNAACAAAPVAPQLLVGDDGGTLLAEAGGKVESLPALLGVLARSAILLIADRERGPLQVCAAPSCGMFFLGRRRWCCSACGNRARAARHYRRRRKAEISDRRG